MPDRKKVIKGFELCLKTIEEPDCRKECLYYEACQKYEGRVIFQPLMRDALALLKEQEPRVMTLGEIFTAQKTDTWYEIRNEETIHPLMLVETENSIKNQCAYFWPGTVAPIKGYGKTWRCWTARPTDERRKAVKWE